MDAGTLSYIWNSSVCTVADLHAPELLKEVRQVFAEGLVDTMFASLEGIERDATATKQWRRDRQHLITDAIAEMEWWASFQREDSSPKKLPAGPARVPLAVPDLDSDYVAPQSPPRAEDWQERPMPVRQRQKVQEVLWKVMHPRFGHFRAWRFYVDKH